MFPNETFFLKIFASNNVCIRRGWSSLPFHTRRPQRILNLGVCPNNWTFLFQFYMIFRSIYQTKNFSVYNSTYSGSHRTKKTWNATSITTCLRLDKAKFCLKTPVLMLRNILHQFYSIITYLYRKNFLAPILESCFKILIGVGIPVLRKPILRKPFCFT